MGARRTSRPLAQLLLERLDRIEKTLAALHWAWAAAAAPAPGCWLPPASSLRSEAAEFVPTFGNYTDELFSVVAPPSVLGPSSMGTSSACTASCSPVSSTDVAPPSVLGPRPTSSVTSSACATSCPTASSMAVAPPCASSSSTASSADVAPPSVLGPRPSSSVSPMSGDSEDLRISNENLGATVCSRLEPVSEGEESFDPEASPLERLDRTVKLGFRIMPRLPSEDEDTQRLKEFLNLAIKSKGVASERDIEAITTALCHLLGDA
mmetsp:Transcript_124996/g.365090  ORF Transcript_124996/g.365090 Transcript_124996/m.365090 type:complete len:265 (+) Transcript_124996:112-906(+)